MMMDCLPVHWCYLAYKCKYLNIKFAIRYGGAIVASSTERMHTVGHIRIDGIAAMSVEVVAAFLWHTYGIHHRYHENLVLSLFGTSHSV
jgi:hypothetical protein